MATFVLRKGPGGTRSWQVKIRRRGWPPQSSTFDTRERAAEWARDIEHEMDHGVFVPRKEAENTTLTDALSRYEKEVTAHKKSRAGEAWTIRQWQSSKLANRSIASIRGKDVAEFIEERRASGHGPNTIRLLLALLSHLYTVAASSWGMESLRNPVPLARTARPKLPRGRERRLQDGEEEKLLSVATEYGGEVRLIIQIALETGMRRGEIARMQWEHLDRKARVLRIPETKNGEARTVPLSAKAMQVLESLPRQINGKMWSMRDMSISHAFAQVCKRASVEGLTFHDLRHEATSRLFEKGLNPMEVAAITGHKTLQMLKRYTHLRAEDLAKLLG